MSGGRPLRSAPLPPAPAQARGLGSVSQGVCLKATRLGAAPAALLMYWLEWIYSNRGRAQHICLQRTMIIGYPFRQAILSIRINGKREHGRQPWRDGGGRTQVDRGR